MIQKNFARNGFRLLMGVAICGTVAWVAADCLRVANGAVALYQLGVRGSSIEGDIQFEIQESRRTVLAALNARTFEAQRSFIDQSRAADLSAERLQNQFQLLAVTPVQHAAAREFARAWTEYLGVRDTEAALTFANRRDAAFDIDLQKGDPDFRRAYDTVQKIKVALDQYSIDKEAEVRLGGYRASAELVLLSIGFLVALLAVTRNRRQGIVPSQVLSRA
jgi:hypothetical protein